MKTPFTTATDKINPALTAALLAAVEYLNEAESTIDMIKSGDLEGLSPEETVEYSALIVSLYLYGEIFYNGVRCSSIGDIKAAIEKYMTE